MKSMTLRLNEAEYEQLRMLALVGKRSMADLIREAIGEYIHRRASRAEFRSALDRAMRDNARLISDLADC